MDKTRTPTSGPLARLRAWLRGDRFMVDSRPPAAAVAEPPAAPAPAAGPQAPAKED
jgi:hypothetical protein